MFVLVMYLQANKVYKDLEKSPNAHSSLQIRQLLKQNKQPKNQQPTSWKKNFEKLFERVNRDCS